MKRAKNRTVAAAIEAGQASGAAAAFRREDSGRAAIVGAPSAIRRAACSARAQRLQPRRRRDARAPQIGEW